MGDIENYKQLFDKFLLRKEMATTDFLEYRDLIEQGIILMRSCCKEVYINLQEEAKAKGEIIQGPKSLIPFLFEKANYYLIASYELCCLGLYNPASALLRNVYEIILRIYFLYLTDEEAEIWYKSDVGVNLTLEEKKYLIKNSYFSHKVLIALLYSPELQNNLKEFYHEISTSTHSSIVGMHNDLDYNKDLTKDRLGFILDLECGLFIALFETYNVYLLERKDNILDFIKNIGEIDGSLPNFSPDKPEFATKFFCRFE